MSRRRQGQLNNTLVQDICHEYIAKVSQSTVGNWELSASKYYILFWLLLSDSTGSVLCSVENPVPVTTRVEARIIVFNIDIPITVGFPVSAVKSITTKKPMVCSVCVDWFIACWEGYIQAALSVKNVTQNFEVQYLFS